MSPRNLGWLFLAALLLRAAFLGVWYEAGRGERIPDDATEYVEIAQNLLQGKGYRLAGELSLRRPPVYALVTLLCLKAGIFPLGLQVLQILIGAFSCLLLYQLGKEIAGARAGFWAACFLAVDYLSIRQAVAVVPEVLFVFFLLGAFYFLVQFHHEKKSVPLLLSGALFGVSALTKDSLLFYLPAAAAWIFFLDRKRVAGLVRAGRTAFFIGGITLITGPWIARNILQVRKPVLITVSSGHSFYLGNNPSTPLLTSGGEWITHVPEDPGLPPLYTVEADRYLRTQALRFIRENPARFIELAGSRILNMWRPFHRDAPRAAQIAALLTYLPVLLLGMMGMILSLEDVPRFFPFLAWIFYLGLIHAVTISAIRYRFPAMPFLMIFAGLALMRIFNREKLPHAVTA